MNASEIDKLCEQMRSVEGTLNSGAFHASVSATRLLKALSQVVEEGRDKEKIDREENVVGLTQGEIFGLSARLRYFSGAISNPARERFNQAADVLDALIKPRNTP